MSIRHTLSEQLLHWAGRTPKTLTSSIFAHLCSLTDRLLVGEILARLGVPKQHHNGLQEWAVVDRRLADGLLAIKLVHREVQQVENGALGLYEPTRRPEGRSRGARSGGRSGESRCRLPERRRVYQLRKRGG